MSHTRTKYQHNTWRKLNNWVNELASQTVTDEELELPESLRERIAKERVLIELRRKNPPVEQPFSMPRLHTRYKGNKPSIFYKRVSVEVGLKFMFKKKWCVITRINAKSFTFEYFGEPITNHKIISFSHWYYKTWYDNDVLNLQFIH